MHLSHRRLLAVVATVAALAGLAARSAEAETYDYGNDAYRAHDLDNFLRSLGPGSRQLSAALDPAQAGTIVTAGLAEWLSNLGTQLSGLSAGRVYATLGSLLPGANVGDPETYGALPAVEVDFASRTGAQLHGRLWYDGRPGPHPGIVITPGSIQSPAVGYHWAAQSLARAGYLVLTFDPQGQGESETFGHAPGNPLPTLDGVPFQQAPNFIDGTVDALRFLLSTPGAPYVPGGWDDADVAAHRSGPAGAGLSWANPLAGVLDAANVGLAGHSLGGSAVSVVQQCSDAADRWQHVPACMGRAYPIRAVVGWDRLSAGGGIVPVVPGMDQQADGYFMFPELALTSPSPNLHLHTRNAYAAAGVDSYAITVRGGTHCEWSWIPAICAATGYGLAAVDHYTRLWFDRYLHPDPARRAAAGQALLDSPVPDGATGGADELPWRANFLSVRFRSGYTCECVPGGGTFTTDDLRRAVGLSRVGDWAGAHADRPAVRRA